MQRANLSDLEWRAVGRAKFVEITKLGNLDEILCMPEKIEDWNDLDSYASRGVHQPAKLLVSVSVFAGDFRQTWILDGIFEMKMQLLVSPFRIPRQLRQQPIQSLNLPCEVPLKRANHAQTQ